MQTRDLVDLILLAAIWGASFLFMRHAAPAFGPFALVEVRVAVAVVFLLALLAWRRQLPALRAHALSTGLVGVLSSAIPFVLLTYALLTLTAGFTSILNATTPMWTALIARLWLRERITAVQWLGLTIGLAGVAVLSWGKVDFRPGATGFAATLAIGACLAATLAYGIAANLTKRRLSPVDSHVIAAGSQCGAALAVLPLAVVYWPATLPGPTQWLATITLGIVCTALAYLLYFRLILRIGAMRAASVTFLIPAFGTAWGALFLDESITLQMLAGGAVILLGTALALGLPQRSRPAAGNRQS